MGRKEIAKLIVWTSSGTTTIYGDYMEFVLAFPKVEGK